jgi:glutamine phosphoribosylpyrophosphate amidotransferase
VLASKLEREAILRLVKGMVEARGPLLVGEVGHGYSDTLPPKRVISTVPPNEIDVVIPIPESSRPSAAQLAQLLGLPYREGFVKNRYVGRTFIMPGQAVRKKSVRQKLNVIASEFKGRNVLLVDDSIVRGTTTRAMVAMLRESGAAEVHMRISSPPYKWPCFYGMDTGTRGELLAANMSVDEIREYLNVDTLSYLAIDRLLDATGAVGAGFCDACLTGNYPVEIPVALTERVVDLQPKADSRFTPVATQFAEFLEVETTLPAGDGTRTSHENE